MLAGHRAMSGKAQTDDTPEKQAQIRASLANRVIIRFTPERTISCNHAKLGAFY